MRQRQSFIVEGKRVYVGFEDSKRTWRLCVRSMGMIVDDVSMSAEYSNLRSYLSRCILNAGFGSFWILMVSTVRCRPGFPRWWDERSWSTRLGDE